MVILLGEAKKYLIIITTLQTCHIQVMKWGKKFLNTNKKNRNYMRLKKYAKNINGILCSGADKIVLKNGV